MSISTCALREEGDSQPFLRFSPPNDFYPRPPRGGRPSSVSLAAAAFYFYPRPPRGGRPSRPSFSSPRINFYPRPPRGGRRCGGRGAVRCRKISIHALREEGDLQRGRLASAKEDFYPRPPRGGRPSATGRLTVHSRFLSTPSARRATFLLFFFGEFIEISIHALREEGDIRFRPVSTTHCNFYPRPPRGGRPSSVSLAAAAFYFYPRPPRGGRPSRPSFSSPRINFYPRPPRGGRRCGGRGAVRCRKISIHALREEGDLQRGRLASAKEDFYPRPPRGGRQQKQRQNLYFLINYTTFCTNLEEP